MEPRRHQADGNIRKRYPIEDARWIWHPTARAEGLSVVRFVRPWNSPRREEAVFHVTADQRYVLYLDGRRISAGPDRSDVAHWAFTALSVVLPPGHHTIVADVVWVDSAWTPESQPSFRAGFLFKAEGTAENLDTGSSGWLCAEREGVAFREDDDTDYPALRQVSGGTSCRFDGVRWHGPPTYVRPKVIARYWDTSWGLSQPIWRLHGSGLPEQLSRRIVPGEIRAAWRGDPSRPADSDRDLLAAARDFLRRNRPLVVPANETVNLLWDLDDYYCAYPVLTTSGGKGARIACEWAESLFEARGRFASIKGNRDEITGKVFFGFGDLAVCAGRRREVYSSLWWRSGRYLRLSVRTEAEPLTLRSVVLEESRYPVENEGVFEADSPSIAEIVRVASRGLQMCAHETLIDCPYYDQIPYTAYSRLELLALYVMTPDIAMARRVLQHFAWSQGRTGFIAERYPAEPFQLSLTFSLLWFSMVREYVYWRDDRAWVRENLLVPMRGALENFIALLGNRYVLGSEAPGWSFLDWAPEWPGGVAPTGEDGRSASVNMLLVRGFRDAALVERAVGEELMALRYEAVADKVARRVRELFWTPSRHLFAEDTGWKRYSKHAQCLAILSGTVTDPGEIESCLRGAFADEQEAATPYFLHYILEMCAQVRRPAPAVAPRIVSRLATWEGFVGLGLRTPVDKLDSSRSDCHGWGSHPLYHLHATVAGVRPASPGFRSVSLRPILDMPYGRVRCKTPHPRGWIETSWTRTADGIDYRVALPYGTPGRLEWAGTTREIEPGASLAVRFGLP